MFTRRLEGQSRGIIGRHVTYVARERNTSLTDALMSGLPSLYPDQRSWLLHTEERFTRRRQAARGVTEVSRAAGGADRADTCY
jgi:hypothetical protein